MKTISMKKHIGKDGKLNISIPMDIKERDVEVVVIVESSGSNRWDDFFDVTYGLFHKNKIIRPAQGPYPERDSLT